MNDCDNSIYYDSDDNTLSEDYDYYMPFVKTINKDIMYLKNKLYSLYTSIKFTSFNTKLFS